MKLPERFVERMKNQLGAEYEAFERTYDEAPYVGLRVNTLKISVERFLELFPYEVEPIPWTTDGFYYNEEDPVTKHPLYYAGLYYIQEPSAMSPVTVLKPRHGDTVLDLCAAPGGKSVQIAGATGDSGLLVTNDINDKRVKAIVRNVEKYGVKNVLVLNDDQYAISENLPHFFNKVLIDAPCSGEGMFKKDTKAIKAWEAYANETCAKMQTSILGELDKMLKVEADIVYSTCTFSPMENEEQILQLIESQDRFSISPFQSECFEIKDGGMAHLWPHQIKGEGHFLANIKWQSDGSDTTCNEINHDELKSSLKRERNSKKKHKHSNDSKRSQNREVNDGKAAMASGMRNLNRFTYFEEAPLVFASFLNEYMDQPFSGKFLMEQDRLFLLPESHPELYKVLKQSGLHVARIGWLLGEIKNNRFTPSQAFAMGLEMNAFNNCLNLSSDSADALKYLKGETLYFDEEHAVQNGSKIRNGYCLIGVDGFPLGFAKAENGRLKNLYPVSWRMM